MMMGHRFALPVVIALSAATAAHAQDLSNAPWAAQDLKTVFHSACVASQPALIERRAQEMAASLGYATIAGDADLTVTSADAVLTIAVDGNPIETSCTVTLPASAYTGASGDMQSALTQVFADLNDDQQPDGSETSDGAQWSWASNDTYYDATYTQTSDQLTIDFTVSR